MLSHIMKPKIFIMVLTAWLIHSAVAQLNQTQDASLVDIEDDQKGKEAAEEQRPEKTAPEKSTEEEQSHEACIELTNWKVHHDKKELTRFFPQSSSLKKEKLIGLMLKKCLENIPEQIIENILQSESNIEYSKLNEYVQLNYIELKPSLNWTISDEEQRLISEYRENYPKSSSDEDPEFNELVRQYKKPAALDKFEKKLLKYIKRLYERIEFSKVRLAACHIMAKKKTQKDLIKIVNIEDAQKVTVDYMPKIKAIMTSKCLRQFSNEKLSLQDFKDEMKNYKNYTSLNYDSIFDDSHELSEREHQFNEDIETLMNSLIKINKEYKAEKKELKRQKKAEEKKKKLQKERQRRREAKGLGEISSGPTRKRKESKLSRILSFDIVGFAQSNYLLLAMVGTLIVGLLIPLFICCCYTPKIPEVEESEEEEPKEVSKKKAQIRRFKAKTH